MISVVNVFLFTKIFLLWGLEVTFCKWQLRSHLLSLAYNELPAPWPICITAESCGGVARQGVLSYLNVFHTLALEFIWNFRRFDILLGSFACIILPWPHIQNIYPLAQKAVCVCVCVFIVFYNASPVNWFIRHASPLLFYLAPSLLCLAPYFKERFLQSSSRAWGTWPPPLAH